MTRSSGREVGWTPSFARTRGRPRAHDEYWRRHGARVNDGIEDAGDDFRRLLDHLSTHGTRYGIDRERILALSQNAPITIVNHHAGKHGFEGRSDDARTRAVIEETIEFVKRTGGSTRNAPRSPQSGRAR